MSLLEKCCKCLGTGRKDVCNPKALLNLGQFKNVDKEYFVLPLFPFFFLFFAASPSRPHKRKQSSEHSDVFCASETTNSQQGHSSFSLASTCSIHQHGDSCPSEAEELQKIWVGGSAACAAAPAGCILYLSSVDAVGITTMYKSLWISYVLLGSEAVN